MSTLPRLLLAVSLALVPSAPALAMPPEAPAVVAPAPDTPVITVDGRSVSLLAFQRLFGALQHNHLRYQGIDFDAPEGRAARDEARRGLIDQLVEWLMLEAGAAQEGLVATPRDLDAELATWVRADGAAEFENRLASQRLTREDIAWSVRAAVLTRRTLEWCEARVTIDEAELRAHFDESGGGYDLPEQVRVRHLLTDTEAKARGLLDQLRRGASFAMLARHYSQDPATCEVGGAFGYFSRGSLLPEFEAAAFALRPGERSGVVHTDAGYHVIEGLDHRPGRARAFEEARDDVREALVAEKSARAQAEWLETVRHRHAVMLSPALASPADHRAP